VKLSVASCLEGKILVANFESIADGVRSFYTLIKKRVLQHNGQSVYTSSQRNWLTTYQHKKKNTHSEIKRQVSDERRVKITYVLHGQFVADYLMSLFIGFANLVMIPGDGDISKESIRWRIFKPGLKFRSPHRAEIFLRLHGEFQPGRNT